MPIRRITPAFTKRVEGLKNGLVEALSSARYVKAHSVLTDWEQLLHLGYWSERERDLILAKVREMAKTQKLLKKIENKPMTSSEGEMIRIGTRVPFIADALTEVAENLIRMKR